MSANRYEVNVITKFFYDRQLGFRSIEIIPPISKELASLACQNVVEYLDSLERDESIPGDSPTTAITAYNFCDEGAKVNTLLKFVYTPTFGGSVDEKDEQIDCVKRNVERTISPSGKGIRDKYEY